MYCDIIHEERKKEYSECPLCNEKLEETKSNQTKCCDNPDLINGTHKVCKNCGTVSDHLIATEFVEVFFFFENRYRIRKKRIYHQKYHIENVLNALCQKHGIEISYVNRQRIYNIFKLIDNKSIITD